MTRDTRPELAALACCPLPQERQLEPGAVRIWAADLESIREHARRTYPSECCGVLVGVRGRGASVRAVHPTQNRRATRTHDRYELDPRDILRLDRAAERVGEEVVGFYHSHPDHPAMPSATDADYAWPGYVYLIVSVDATGHTEARGWTYDDDLCRFQEAIIRPRGAAWRRLHGIYQAVSTIARRKTQACQSE